MRTTFIRAFSIASLFVAAGLWAGCTVGFDTAAEGQTFPCESNEECLDGFECDIAEGEESGVCQPEGSEEDEPAPPCDGTDEGIDQDADGFGAGENREKCEFDKEDCDDTDADVYPGAAELCDGKINNCDQRDPDDPGANARDDFGCDENGGCSGVTPPELSGYFAYCDESSNTCYFVPPRGASSQCLEDAGAEDEHELGLFCNDDEFTWDDNGEEKTADQFPNSCT